MRRSNPTLLATAWIAALVVSARAEEPLVFEKHVRPILKAHCFLCHGEGTELKGGLDLRLARFIAKGGETGPAMVAGKHTASRIFERVKLGEMPPGDKKLSEEEIARIARWIDQGAGTARPEPESLPPGTGVTEEDRAFWSFQPIRRPTPPAVKNPGLVRTPIDAFLLAKLEEMGLRFAPPADKRTLLLRLYITLTGLPPTPEQAKEFLADPRPDAYERLVETLLASPHYGERWARHWLDVAGYADSDGYTDADAVRPYAYKYRDYVIRSLNADKPFDRFLIEQLAGDELPAPAGPELTAERLELLTATGFLRMGADGTGTAANDLELARNQVVADVLKIVSTGLLGLSVGCAQCHDHRYDPIPQRDYYRLRAVFEPAYDWKNWRTPPQRLISLYTAADRAEVAKVNAQAASVSAERQARLDAHLAAAFEKELTRYPAESRDKLRAAFKTPAEERSDEQKQLVATHPSLNINAGVLYQYNQAAVDELRKYDEKIAAIVAKRPVEDFVAPLMETSAAVPATFVFHRGDYRQPKEEVRPGDLTVTSPPEQPREFLPRDPKAPTSGRRLALARRLTDGEHPLVPRVLVNRVWMHHFGRGIVATPSEFGSMGDPPSHPELLDWLASTFVDGGWKLKDLHRQILLSSAFRQSSVTDAKKRDLDPERRLLSAMPVRRLDAEAIRDRILSAAGTLDPRMYGPPTPVRENAVGQITVGPDLPAKLSAASLAPPGPRDDLRRSLYLQVRRSQPVAMLRVFDAPVMETNCDRRTHSTVAPQALFLMNSEFISQQSAYFASRVRRERPGDPEAEIARAFQIALLREPTPAERRAAKDLFAPTRKFDDPSDNLTDLCQVLFSSNEFLYLD